ncbi:hypothetical protein M758_UG313000 [Ceratodon purpureus]|nr:hypothetical protein M758_UG313000 [Ceratodon purpureus]
MSYNWSYNVFAFVLPDFFNHSPLSTNLLAAEFLNHLCKSFWLLCAILPEDEDGLPLVRSCCRTLSHRSCIVLKSLAMFCALNMVF